MKKMTLMAAAMLLSMMSFAQVNLQNGLLHYYPFTGDATDAVGTADGMNSGATLTSDRFGDTSSAYNFIPNGTRTLDAIIGTFIYNDFSINFWYSTTSPVAKAPVTLYAANDPFDPTVSGDYYFMSYISKYNLTQYPALQISERNSNMTCDPSQFVTTTTALSNATWHMVTINKVDTTLSFYVDTVLMGTTTLNPFSCNGGSFTDGTLTLGGFNPDFSVDDVMLYDRLLNAAERAALFNVTATYSPTTGIESQEVNALQVSLFPNPIANSLQLNFPTAADYLVRVFDAAGRQVAVQVIQNGNSLEMNTTTWAAGLYAVQIRDDKGAVVVKKVTKL